MFRRYVSVFLIAAAMALPVSGLAQVKITVDPNAAGSAVFNTEEKSDPRLSQKITYNSGYIRLHDVCEDLTRISNVAIRSGKNGDDWKVRDIPVVVCVKDLPLGKLLRAIADATHTDFRAEKVGKDDPEKTYRIYRKSETQADIDTFRERMRESQLAIAKWDWDAAVAVGKGDRPTEMGDAEWAMAWAVSKLGPQVRDRVLNGDTVELDPSDLAVQSVIEEFFKAVNNTGRSFDSSSGRSATGASLPSTDSFRTFIKFKNTGESDHTNIDVIIAGKTGMSSHNLAMAAGEKAFSPARPKPLQRPFWSEDMLNPNVQLAHKDVSLQEKIDLVKPEKLEDPKFVDVIQALATATGLNIVTEDFASQLSTYDAKDPHSNVFYSGSTDNGLVAPIFTKDTTAMKVLLALHPRFTDYSWFSNRSEKLLIGWVADWRQYHADMPSEEYLTRLKTDMNGPGVPLDDAVHLMTFTDNGFRRWISESEDLSCLGRARDTSQQALWRLFDILNREDKQVAKSKDGLPLSKFDANWVMAFFREQKLSQDATLYRAAEDISEAATSDSAAVKSMVLRVKASEPIKTEGLPDRLMYNISLDYSVNGQTRTMSSESAGLTVPIWSPERIDEMKKAASKSGL